MSTIKSLVAASGMSQRAFADYFKIPLRTVEDWCRGVRKCPDYLIALIAYKLRAEKLIQ